MIVIPRFSFHFLLEATVVVQSHDQVPKDQFYPHYYYYYHPMIVYLRRLDTGNLPIITSSSAKGQMMCNCYNNTLT